MTSTPWPAPSRSTTPAGLGDGTRWVLTQMGTPIGVAVSPSGALYYSDASFDTVRVIGGGHDMSRFGRRTFLASSAGVAAGAAVGRRRRGPCAAPAGGDAARAAAWGAPSCRRGHPARCGLAAHGQRLGDPVGVDPDDCSFAWTLQATRRSVMQTAYRIVVRRTDPAHGGLVWDSGPVLSARQAFVAYGGPPLAADAAYEWTVQPTGPGGALGAGVGAGPVHHGAAAGRLAGPVAAPRRRLPAARPRHLPAHRGHTAGGHPPPGHRLRLCRPHLPAVRRRRTGGRVAQLLLPRRAVRRAPST